MTNAQATGLSDRDLITSLLNSFFIVDYGYINKVNADKTINVTHSAKPVLLDGTELPETTTDNVEVLTVSGIGFSIQWDYKAGDQVLLLGLKDYVPKVKNVTKAEVPQSFLHYNRETIKAIPLCIFNSDALVKIEVESGKMTVTSPYTKLTGGQVEIGGVVAPTGQGALCGIPFCPFTGAPQTGSITSGT